MRRPPDASGHFGRFVPETLMATTDDLEAQIRALRRVTTKPVCVGFGIGRPEHAAAIGRLADGVIVGSAIGRLVEERAASASLVSDVGDFIASLKAPLHGGPARERVERGA